MNPNDMKARLVGLDQRYRIRHVAAGAAIVIVGMVLFAFIGGRAGGIPLLQEAGNSVSYGGRDGGYAIDADYYEESSASPQYYGKVAATGGSIMPPIAPSPDAPASTGQFPVDDRKVIRNGSLDLLVSRTEDAVAAIGGIASTYKGFVDSSNVYEVRDGVKAGYVTIRVPSDSFVRAIADIKAIAVKVEGEQTNSQDVTAQFVDLEAQLKNYRAEELQYQKIMDRATKIEDVLNVASRLAEVRGRIEMTQGQLNYLSRQVSMSTITVSLTSEAQIEVGGIVWRPLAVAKEAIQDLLVRLAALVDSLIRFAFYLPILAIEAGITVLVIFLGWRVGRALWRKYVRTGQGAVPEQRR